MNFFGHACLASERRRDAGFVFGAMLPDLAAMAGLRVALVADPAVGAGRGFHFATDAAFHRAPAFQSLSASASRALVAAGVRRGPARAIGHVGIELLLDGWLAERRGVPASYAEALARASALTPHVVFRNGAAALPLLALCGRIAAAPTTGASWCEPARLAARLARILARRPRLALEAGELPAVRTWAAGARREIACAAPSLLHQVRRRLPSDPAIHSEVDRR